MVLCFANILPSFTSHCSLRNTFAHHALPATHDSHSSVQTSLCAHHHHHHYRPSKRLDPWQRPPGFVTAKHLPHTPSASNARTIPIPSAFSPCFRIHVLGISDNTSSLAGLVLWRMRCSVGLWRCEDALVWWLGGDLGDRGQDGHGSAGLGIPLWKIREDWTW